MKRYNKIFEASYSFLPITDLPLFDTMMKKPDYFRDSKGITFDIVQMSAKEYMEKLRKGWREDPYDLVDWEKVERFADDMRKGDKFFMPHIEYRNHGKHLSQEGRHRVLAMDELGVKKFNVLIVYNDG